jgi:hypothetical protein
MSTGPPFRPGDFVKYQGHSCRVTDASPEGVRIRTCRSLGSGFPLKMVATGCERPVTLDPGTVVLVAGQLGEVVSHSAHDQIVTVCMKGTVVVEEVDANAVDVPARRLLYALVDGDGAILTVGSAADIHPQWSSGDDHPRGAPLQFWKATPDRLELLVGGNVVAQVIKCVPKMTGAGMFAVYPWIDPASRNVLVGTTPDYKAATQSVLTALPETWPGVN